MVGSVSTHGRFASHAVEAQAAVQEKKPEPQPEGAAPKDITKAFQCKYDGEWHWLDDKEPGLNCCRPMKRACDSVARLAIQQKEVD